MTSNQRSSRLSVNWKEVTPLISHFTVWYESPELSWFKKSWNGLMVAGLTDYSNDEQLHRVYIRAIALGIMYRHYCQLEWDEYCDEYSLIEELYWDEEINKSRIGNMMEGNFDMAEFDEQELFCSMVLDLVAQVRLDVYDALIEEFGGASMLYAGLYLSREVGTDQNKLGERMDDVFDSSHFPRGREEAFQWVLKSMIGTEA
jgi:hypothetical protein